MLFICDESPCGEVILDLFAGSGTTAHAVIDMNREDEFVRKYVLVEMGDHFDTVLLPRIKKVVYSDTWKNGRPDSGSGISQIVKYIRLESFEDALSSISLADNRNPMLKFDDYMLQYMLDAESRDSGGRCSISRGCPRHLATSSISMRTEKLSKSQLTWQRLLPICSASALRQSAHTMTESVATWCNRGLMDERDTVVIWRETEGWEQKDFEQDRAFVAKEEVNQGRR